MYPSILYIDDRMLFWSCFCSFGLFFYILLFLTENLGQRLEQNAFFSGWRIVSMVLDAHPFWFLFLAFVQNGSRLLTGLWYRCFPSWLEPARRWIPIEPIHFSNANQTWEYGSILRCFSENFSVKVAYYKHFMKAFCLIVSLASGQAKSGRKQIISFFGP